MLRHPLGKGAHYIRENTVIWGGGRHDDL